MRNAAFWRFGWRMARRSLSRSALAAISLAVATLVAAFSLTIDTGQPGTAAVAARRYLGGSIIVQIPALALPGVDLPSGASWAWQPPAPGGNGPLGWLDPELAWAGTSAAAATPAEVARASALLAHFPGVAQATPVEALPALWAYAPGRYARVDVIARSAAVDRATGFASGAITAGRYFLPGEADQPVALVDGYRPALTSATDRSAGYSRDNGRLVALSQGRPEVLPAPVPAVGGNLSLMVPIWTGGAADWSRLRPVGLRVVGAYAVPEGHWDWISQKLTPGGMTAIPAGSAPGGPVPSSNQVVEPADWTTGTVLVPAGYWRTLAAQVGWSPPAGRGAWVLNLQGGLADLNQVEAALQQALPDATVAEVPALDAATSLQRDPALAVPVQDALAAERGATPTQTSPGVPPWIARLTSLAGYVVAVLLFGGNLYVIVINRRREVAALRAAGAGMGEVAALLGAEIGAVASLGAICGLAVALPFLTWQVLSNGLGIGGMLAAWGRLLAVVVGGTLPLAAVTLALATIWAARLPVLAVLRGG